MDTHGNHGQWRGARPSERMRGTRRHVQGTDPGSGQQQFPMAVDLDPGLDPVLDPVMADLIVQVNATDHRAWLAMVERIGGCANPLHLAGSTTVRDAATGAVRRSFHSRDAPGGVVLGRCRNRRASVCPSCARLYAGDVYHLVRAGLEGGKGVPESVAGHPRVFATLTAPSFGAVHASVASPAGGVRPCRPRRTGRCEHGRVTSCMARHDEDDPLVGTPLCRDCYDYEGAVVWQASVGALWGRFRVYLPRHLGALTGRSRAQVHRQVRTSHVKIVEFQRRGLVHVHAVIRADGVPAKDQPEHPDEPDAAAGAGLLPPPGWVSADLLGQAVVSAAQAVSLEVDGGPAGAWHLEWGTQMEVHDITAAPAGQQGGSGQDAGKVAAYVAKYATKSVTDSLGPLPRPGLEASPRALHAAGYMRAAYRLAEVEELADLKLGRWVKELAHRGHVSSKSRRYSTTLGALRQARAEHHRTRVLGEEVTEQEVVESAWEVVGHGYTPGQGLLAADIARDQDINRAAAREAGAARSRVGGRAYERRPDSARERGARVGDGE